MVVCNRGACYLFKRNIFGEVRTRDQICHSTRHCSQAGVCMAMRVLGVFGLLDKK